MIFTKLPRELRDIIYEYVFHGFPCDTPSSSIAAPLLTCRQFYFEARLLAFARIDWRIDVGSMCKEYYSNDDYLECGDLITESAISSISNVWGTTSSKSPLSDIPTTPYFTMKSLMTNAGFDVEQRAALRRITIVNCWYDWHVDTFQKRPPHDILWYVLHDLRDMLAASQHLDCITLERPEPIAWKDLPPQAYAEDGLPHWKPSLDLMWAMDVTKRFLLKGRSESDTETQQVRSAGQEYVEICWDRMEPNE